MRKMHKTKMAVWMLALMILFSGCSFEGAEPPGSSGGTAGGGGGAAGTKIDKSRGEIKIGFSIKNQNAPYFVAMMNAAKNYAKELGVQLVTADAQGNMTKQISDVNDMLVQGIDLLLLDPADPDGLVPATKSASAKGVPVVIVDSTISEKADYVTTVQSNNTENGVKVGEWVASQFGNKDIKAAVISGEQGNPAGLERRQGVLRGITEAQLRNRGSSKLEIVAQGWGNWATEGGLSAMEDILVAHPDINLLITENDSMAIGARKAIVDAGKESQILIAAAADGQKEALQLIKEGKYGATGLNDPVLIVKTGLDAALKILEEGAAFPKTSYTPAVAITKKNVDEYYKPDAEF